MDHRRSSARIEIDGFCSEISDGRERHGHVLDLSEVGLRLERPFVGGPTPREIQLELEIPEIDEVIWARGAICFDQLRRAPRGSLVRASGIRLIGAAARDLRLIRDYVTWRRRARESIEDAIGWSSAFALG